jgi:hypothetical protein
MEHEKYLKTVGKNLEWIVRKKGYSSLSDFAKNNGLCPDVLYNYVRGTDIPELTLLYDICKLLKIEFSEPFEIPYMPPL